MKYVPVVMSALVLSSAVTSAQSKAPTPSAKATQATAAFDRLKSLAGRWTGTASSVAPAASTFPVQVSMRITSGDDAFTHEMVPAGRLEDPAHGDDDPVTMIYLENDHLALTHYCDNGKNRPHMRATASPDGKSIDFDLVALSGETKRGHMHHAKFTMVDAVHHTEEWTYVMPDGTKGVAHIDLVRSKGAR